MLRTALQPARPLARPRGRPPKGVSPYRLARLRRVPSVGQMNAGRTKTRCAQTVRPAFRHSSIRLRLRRHGDGWNGLVIGSPLLRGEGGRRRGEGKKGLAIGGSTV